MKPRILKCKYCGKEFTTTAKAQKFCSVRCRYIFSQQKRCKKEGYEYKKKKRRWEQLCWDCKKACGGCAWSRNLTPVKGWVAEPTTIRFKGKNGVEHITDTYKIFECPEFERV